MRTWKRVLLAGVLSAAIGGASCFLLGLFAREVQVDGRDGARASGAAPGASGSNTQRSQEADCVLRTAAPRAPSPSTIALAKPFKKDFDEAGEDPGAVYYLNRVREAIREGNSGFAHELFRQMRLAHTNSALVSEAEISIDTDGSTTEE